MAVTGQTWAFFAGDLCRIPIVQVEDGDGAAIDLTGREVRFALCPYTSSGAVLYAAPTVSISSLDTAPAVTIPNPAGGTTEDDPHVLVTLLPALTAPLALSKVTPYYVEIEVLEGDGSGKVTVATGRATFTPTATNDTPA